MGSEKGNNNSLFNPVTHGIDFKGAGSDLQFNVINEGNGGNIWKEESGQIGKSL